jgi:pyruvate/2-oxoglutarate dehydrogenase complex dihydrolipoamide acyltransferase (E2) component
MSSLTGEALAPLDVPEPTDNGRLSQEAIQQIRKAAIFLPFSLAKEIAQEARSLAEKARAGKLTLEEVSGGTFTVSNLGMYGVDGFTPILNTPQTGILGVGRIVEKPVIYRGEIAKRSMMVLSLTFDHRVIDGAPAGAFLQTVAGLLAHGNRISLDAR